MLPSRANGTFHIILPPFSLLDEPSDDFKKLVIDFGSSRSKLYDLHMLKKLNMDRIDTVEILTGVFVVVSDHDEYNMDLRYENEFALLEQVMNYDYQYKQKRGVSVAIRALSNSIAIDGPRSEFRYELQYKFTYYLEDLTEYTKELLVYCRRLDTALTVPPYVKDLYRDVYRRYNYTGDKDVMTPNEMNAAFGEEAAQAEADQQEYYM